MFGGTPSSSSRPASAPIAVIVPIVSKKSASISVKTSRIAVTTPASWKPPIRLNSPSVPKSGFSEQVAEAGQRRHGEGPALRVDAPSAPKAGPMSATFSTMIATTVIDRIEMRIAPLTLRTHSAITQGETDAEDQRPASPASWLPVRPSCSGTVVPATSGAAANPASTKPISAMNRPMPDRDGDLELGRHGVEHRRPEPGEDQDQDDDALDHDEAHRVGPGHLARDGERDEGVEPQAGRQRERVVGDDAHEDREHAGGERRTRRDGRPGWARPRRRGTCRPRPATKPMISGFSTTM